MKSQQDYQHTLLNGKDQLSSSLWKHSQGVHCFPAACVNLPNPRKQTQWAEGCLSIHTLIAISNCFCLFLACFLVIKKPAFTRCSHFVCYKLSARWKLWGKLHSFRLREWKIECTLTRPRHQVGSTDDALCPWGHSHTMNHCPIWEVKPWPLVLLTSRRNAAKEPQRKTFPPV